MTPAAIIRAAAAQGIERLAITDHIHPSTDRGIIDEAREERRRILDGEGFQIPPQQLTVYIGCEADVVAVGNSVADRDLAERADFVMVAATHFQVEYVSQPASRNREDVARHYLEMFKYAASIEFADVIAHPFFVPPDTFDPLAPAAIAEKDLMEAIQIAAKNGIALEISRRALAPEQKPFLLGFYRLCKEAGLKFSIGSDAHQLADVGRTRLVEPLIAELGLTDEDLWTPGRKARG